MKTSINRAQSQIPYFRFYAFQKISGENRSCFTNLAIVVDSVRWRHLVGISENDVVHGTLEHDIDPQKHAAVTLSPVINKFNTEHIRNVLDYE